MAVTIATGTLIAIASTYGTSVNMTAITNATEAVATLGAGHGVVVGDFLEVTSGWDLLSGRIVRVKTVATNDITFELINTSSTSNYPAGTGTGTIRRITAWTNITQVQGIDTSGGDLNFADITTISDRTQKQVPTTRSAQQITLTVFDDPALGWYAPVTAASDSVIATGLRIIFPNGSRSLANGYYSLQKTPTVAVNAPLTADVGFSAVADPVRYPS
jgi:Phage tail tube protein, TTP